MSPWTALSAVGVVLVVVAGCEPVPPPVEECTITGTSGNDVLVGTAGADVICAFDGDDRLLGGAGNDVLVGGGGRDLMNPGPDDDTVFGEGGNDSVNSYTANGGPSSNPNDEGDKTGNDTISLGEGNDSAQAGLGNDIIYDGPGADIVEAEGGDDEIYQRGESSSDHYEGGGGSDYMEADPASPSATGMHGGDGDDVFVGITPLGWIHVHGDAGSDLAVLLDGSGADSFTAQEEPVVPFPNLGLPCTMAAGEEAIEIGCELLPGVSITLGTDGSFESSAPFVEIASELKGIWEQGGVDIDTCYCDNVNVPGFPFMEDLIF